MPTSSALYWRVFADDLAGGRSDGYAPRLHELGSDYGDMITTVRLDLEQNQLIRMARCI